MKAFPILSAVTVLITVGCLAHPFGHAAGLFGNAFSKSPVIRKAARYNLVPVTSAAQGCFVDLRYKFTSASGKPLYVKEMPCLIHRATGKKLREAQNILARQGYALKIWDAWRPPEAHQALWEAVKDPRYVVPPSKGLSWHCYGISVDVTLVKADGAPARMPTKFDVFSEAASSTYRGGDPEVRKNLEILQRAMEKAGFRKINDEWWHFDDPDAAETKVFKVTARDIGISLPE